MNIFEVDETVDNAKFITKVDNVFTLLCMSIMQGDMERCKHKISNEIYEKYKEIVDKNNENNIRQMYDELNINSTDIVNIESTEEGITVDVKIVARYMDYRVEKSTFKFLSGNNSSRIEKEYNLRFFKKASAKALGIARRCPGCGSPADVSNTGKCSFCRAIFNTVDYDYLLIGIN